MKRTPLKRKSRLRAKPKPKLTPEQLLLRNAWYISVTRFKGKVAPCIVCGGRGQRIQGHHVVSQGFIKANVRDHLHKDETPEDATERLTWDYRNGAPVCALDHERHENGSHRIPREKLPLRARAWASEHGFEPYINRHYPEVAQDGSSNDAP